MSTDLHLLPYLVLLIGIIVLPGMDMAYVLAQTLGGGGRAGFAALMGIVAGGVVHVTVAALGLGVVVHTMPQLFNAMLLIGACYLAWIGWSLWRSDAVTAAPKAAASTASGKVFLKGMAVCLMNPKAYMFTMAVFPQFIRPEYGPILPQALTVGVMTAAVQFTVYGAVALAAARTARWLGESGRGQVRLAKAVGGLLMVGAVVSVVTGWR